ncbi:MAG: biliverdin-producing heme oxygenase [Deltaproteobacteria bacterium]|nr:biliverdin-producing heme oxygenase [Deltaproteobacteria bacterium]
MTETSQAAAPSLLERLRVQTHASHTRLDRGVRLAPHEITVDRYAAFLRGSLAIVAPLEDVLASHEVLELARARSAALREDLATLDLADDVARSEVSFVNDRAEAIGAAYVMEGSALGGQVLARHVATALRLEPTQKEEPTQEGLGYLRVHGETTGARWRSFLARLAAFDAGASESDRERACVAASRTFAAYEDALGRAGAWSER